ncbi:MAG: DegQ family serine endoprotease [Alphaproteobacteria bacterium]
MAVQTGRTGVLLLLFWLASPAPALAETKVVPESRAGIQLSFAPVVKRVAPAVVNIYTRKVVRERRVSPFFTDPFFQRFFGDAFSGLGFGLPQERIQRSLGSGVIVTPDGLVVTNHHVIAGSNEITVVLSDRREFDAEVVTSDEQSDLAVLRIDTNGEALPSLELGDSDELEVGDLVLAIGNPFGVGQTVTSGIVSAIGRAVVGMSDIPSFIQTDAAINPGNSGGALVTLDGKLVGVNTAIFTRSGGSEGIGFAVPSNLVATVLRSVAAGGRLVRPWLGAGGQAVTPEIAESLGLERPAGVLINAIYPGGPAERAGVRVGDVILAVDGKEVVDPQALRFRLATRPVGRDVELALVRQGVRRAVRFPLEAAPEHPPRDATALAGRHPFAGATVANLSPALAEELRMDTLAQGVVVIEVKRGSPASRLGLRARDIVLEVNGERVERVSELERLVARAPTVWRIAVKRGNRVLNVTVTG